MPTYNYGGYIATALESVRAQADDRVEVVVLDGGSTDDTPQVVEKMAAGWPGLRYARQPTRGGIDADMARSVELARGDYCWLLSADDALVPGAVQRMIAEFEAGYEVLLCERVWCDSDLAAIRTQSWLAASSDRTVDLSSAIELQRYFDAAHSLGALFSFMSCIGFRRAAWLRTSPPADVPCYTHVGRFFAMARERARLRYIAAPLVLCRSGADSFREGGLASRLLIDLRGYRQLADTLFAGQPALHASFLAVLRREHPLHRWFNARLQTRDRAKWSEVASELRRHGFGRTELWLLQNSRPLGKLLTLMQRVR